jgi:hypothetical protein
MCLFSFSFFDETLTTIDNEVSCAHCGSRNFLISFLLASVPTDDADSGIYSNALMAQMRHLENMGKPMGRWGDFCTRRSSDIFL